MRKNTSTAESIEKVAAVLGSFDYGIDPDDFIVYELGRLIEEDRASLDDEEFRRLIDEGIHEHVEQSMGVRLRLATLLRGAHNAMDQGANAVAQRVIQALEDPRSDLRNVAVLVRSYTGYLLGKLETLAESWQDEQRSREWILRWRSGQVSRDALITELHRIGRAAAGPAADLLFEAPEDQIAAETAIDILAGIRSPVSARVLAHVVSEPMLEEDLEAKAFDALRSQWQFARHYMLYNLRSHTHEDLPYRWFQLLIDDNDPSAVDLVLEELQVHGANPTYHEDLSALVELLSNSRDPELEDKVLSMMNAQETPASVVAMLEGLL
jgi:hypothetical protein